ncbi:MAG: serine protease [Clostridia bacterium]|jgi:serine protease Do|nr:serine protease [Clostridia bacterium]
MKTKKRNLKTFLIVSSILFILYFIFSFVYITYIDKDTSNSPNYKLNKVQSTVDTQTIENVITKGTSVSNMIEIVSKSVVGISKLKNNNTSIFSANFSTELGIGTGIIVSENGYILSNCHVTGEKYSSCYVTLDNGNVYTANVVWSDIDLDLSICKINVNGLTPVVFGDSSSIKVGQSVYAIGNPIGFEFRRTVTSGIISATNRTIRIQENEIDSYMTDLIQTDATINPGNSGGPLLLADGSVIGINTVKVSSAEGIGFAVPTNVILPVINSFISSNTFNEAYIGISAYDSNVIPYLSSSPRSFSSGIYIAQITSASPATSSDLKIGDIINSVDNIELYTMNDLKSYIYTKKPGDTIVFNISRGKINKEISITLGKK